jgi:hypothetical protein
MCLFWILSNKLDLNQETHFTILWKYNEHIINKGHGSILSDPGSLYVF